MPQQNTGKENKKLWQACLSFGLTVGISIYILAFLLGAWLDEKLGIAPVCTIIGALLAIASSFARLLKNISNSTRRDKEDAADRKDKEN